jgi:hypothetical protein
MIVNASTTQKDLKDHVKSCHPDAHKSYFPRVYHKKMERERFIEVISKCYFIEDLEMFLCKNYRRKFKIRIYYLRNIFNRNKKALIIIKDILCF